MFVYACVHMLPMFEAVHSCKVGFVLAMFKENNKTLFLWGVTCNTPGLNSTQ